MFAYMTDIQTVDMKERREVEAEGNQHIKNYEVKIYQIGGGVQTEFPKTEFCIHVTHSLGLRGQEGLDWIF